MEHSEEVLNVKCLEYSSPSWTRSIFADDQAIKWAKAKVCVYADTVLWSRSDRKMARSSGRTQVVFVLPRCSGNPWRSHWSRVVKFQDFHHCLQERREREHPACEDNTSKDPFSRCDMCKNLGYRLGGRSQRQEHHWRHEAQDQHEAQDETHQCVQRLKTLWEHVRMRVVLQSSWSVSVLLLSHSSLAHRTLAQDVCVCVSFHPMVITMSHAWVERSLWLPWPFHPLHFPPLLHLYLPALPPSLHLPWG